MTQVSALRCHSHYPRHVGDNHSAGLLRCMRIRFAPRQDGSSSESVGSVAAMDGNVT